MRVTIVTETFFPQLNGVSRTLGELVRHLRQSGDDVQVICPDYGTRSHYEQVLAVPSVSLPFYKELHLPRPPFGRVHRAVNVFRPDIVHISTEATLGWSLLRHANTRGLPVVSSFHTNFDQYSGHYGLGWARGLIWRYLRWFHNSTLETYVPSYTTIRMLDSMGFQRLELWRRGVDSELFRPDRPGRLEVRRALGWSPDDVVITYVGRIAPEKNVDYLADALAMLASRRTGVRILFVGDGPSRRALEARIGAIAHFAGYRHGADLADHYAAADLFAFASRTETLGNVVLEAMSSGLPVVALKAGGVSETVQPGSTGILLAPDEPADRFAAALLWLIEQSDERRRMAEAARSSALAQSWEAIMGSLRDRYQCLIGREPVGASSQEHSTL
jgi:glycosyltransferase involved in cell wall biosynthesis